MALGNCESAQGNAFCGADSSKVSAYVKQILLQRGYMSRILRNSLGKARLRLNLNALMWLVNRLVRFVNTRTRLVNRLTRLVNTLTWKVNACTRRVNGLTRPVNTITRVVNGSR